MTDTLWLRFAEDSGLPQVLTPAEQVSLSDIFNAPGSLSLWSQAILDLGLKLPGNTHYIRWLDGYPYMNWSAVVQMLGAGWLEIVRHPDQTYSYKTRMAPLAFVSFLWRQFWLSLYLAKHLKAPLPVNTDDGIRESLALGIVLLSLTLRLPQHDQATLAGWLVNPSDLKPAVRRTLQDIQKVQLRRTVLSQFWHEMFPPRTEETSQNNPIPYFWNEPDQAPLRASLAPSSLTSWRGLPVSGGTVTGRAVIVGRDMAVPETSDPLIFIFARARPESTEFFSKAAAVVYAEGGALSHACTVAREQGIPCVTAAGRSLLTAIGEKEGSVWLSVDGTSGTVDIIG